ncbi:hypothetical protein D1839_06130 [Roseburia sp. 1XD42-34]|nr:hypothetical protein [Roseburia sp. 1XD42-34]RKI79952.1 hypothetical protein D7V87_06120 [Clostridium sp. 1xD42-85]
MNFSPLALKLNSSFFNFSYMLVYRIWDEIENKKQDGFKKIEWVKMNACIDTIVKFPLIFQFSPLYIITKQGLSVLFVNALYPYLGLFHVERRNTGNLFVASSILINIHIIEGGIRYE